MICPINNAGTLARMGYNEPITLVAYIPVVPVSIGGDAEQFTLLVLTSLVELVKNYYQ